MHHTPPHHHHWVLLVQDVPLPPTEAVFPLWPVLFTSLEALDLCC